MLTSLPILPIKSSGRCSTRSDRKRDKKKGSSAKLNAVDPLAYLTATLTAIVNGHKQSRIDELILGNWFRKWAAVVGFSLLGPTFLAYSITSFLHGELPGRRGSAITSADSPYLFYPLALALVCGSALMAYLSVMFVIGYVRGRSHREK
ncbi:hypothetical protein GGD52_005058 [Agrobacterium tumefaciens]|nr:hypothetical protein [Agrobacterium radiobacter]MBB5590425.1 hypothetical protein [Agrobacterium radiobacter]